MIDTPVKWCSGVVCDGGAAGMRGRFFKFGFIGGLFVPCPRYLPSHHFAPELERRHPQRGSLGTAAKHLSGNGFSLGFVRKAPPLGELPPQAGERALGRGQATALRRGPPLNPNFHQNQKGETHRSLPFLFNYANQGCALEPICIAPSSALMVPGQFRTSPPQVPVTEQPASTVMDMVAWMASSMQLISTLEPAVIRM